MSFLAGSKTKPERAPRTLGLDADRTASSESAKPLTYLAGKNRVAVTYLSRAYDIATRKVTKDGGLFAGSITLGYQYYASLAAAVCLGPIDAIQEVWMNNVRVWTGSVTRDGGHPDYADVTITGRGVMRIYWGTETQSADSDLNNTALKPPAAPSGGEHPAYRGLCYVRFKRLYFGQGITSAPNIEVVVSRYTDSGFIATDIEMSDDMNPAAVVADILTHPRLLALPTTRIDTTSFNDAADTLYNEGLSISPVVTRAASARQLLAEVCEYFGGYLYTTSAGLIGLALLRAPASVPALPLLTEADLTDEPEMTSGDWSDARNQTRVVFSNREKGYKEDAATWRDAGSKLAAAEPSVATIQRPWITRQRLARQIAGATGAQAALPTLSGRIRVRRPAADALDRGTLFRFSYTALSLPETVFRVTERQQPAPGSLSVEFTIEADRSHLHAGYYDAGTLDDSYSDDTPLSNGGLVNQSLLELPGPLSLPRAFAAPRAGANIGNFQAIPSSLGSVPITVLPLVARADEYTTAYKAHRLVGANSYALIGGDNTFAKYGRLMEDYSAEAQTLDERRGLLVELLGTGEDNNLDPVSFQDALENRILIFTGGEIFSLYQVSLVSGTQFRIYPIRGRYDTMPRAHYTAQPILLVDHSGGGTTARCTCAYPHRLVTGQAITIYGATSSYFNVSSIITRISDTEFDITVSASAPTSETGTLGSGPRFRQPVWIIERAEMYPITASGYRNGINSTFKIQTLVDEDEYTLSSVIPTTISLLARAQRPTAPLNLRRCPDSTSLYGDARTAVYASSGGPSITYLRWDITSAFNDTFFEKWRALTSSWASGEAYDVGETVERSSRFYLCVAAHTAAAGTAPGTGASWQTVWQLLPDPTPATTLEFWDAGTGVKKQTLELSVGRSSYTVTYSTLSVFMTGTPNIEIRAYHRLGPLRSLDYASLYLEKI